MLIPLPDCVVNVKAVPFWYILVNPAVVNDLTMLLNTCVGLDIAPEKCITTLTWLLLLTFAMFTFVTFTGG